MTLIKTAQQKLFAELARTDMKASQKPTFNGYGIDDFGHYQTHLVTLYNAFEVELADNLTSRNPSLPLYLTDCIEKLVAINTQARSYQTDNIIQLQEENPEQFRKNKLWYMSRFISFQLEMIGKVESELTQKLNLTHKKEVFSSDLTTGAGEINFKNKIRANLSKVDLTVLIWWLAEANILEFDGSRDAFVKCIENHFMYYDKGKKMYFDVKGVGPLVSKLNDPACVEVDSYKAQQDLLEKLKNMELPPEKSILKRVNEK